MGKKAVEKWHSGLIGGNRCGTSRHWSKSSNGAFAESRGPWIYPSLSFYHGRGEAVKHLSLKCIIHSGYNWCVVKRKPIDVGINDYFLLSKSVITDHRILVETTTCKCMCACALCSSNSTHKPKICERQKTEINFMETSITSIIV